MNKKNKKIYLYWGQAWAIRLGPVYIRQAEGIFVVQRNVGQIRKWCSPDLLLETS
jgi:hypothetical protein